VIAVLTLWFHSPAIGFGFLYYDDPFYATENPFVQGGMTIPGIVWAFGSLEGFYHPVTWLSLMLDVSLYGYSPASFHLTNVLLHGANACLVLLVVAGLGFRGGIPMVAGLIFALHPLNVEPVSWISERKGLLAGFFGLLAILSYVRYVRRPRFADAAFLTLAYGLALLSKASALTLPLLLVLVDVWFLRAVPTVGALVASLRSKALLLGMSAAILPLTVYSEINAGAYSQPFAEWSTPFRSVGCYLWAFLLPIRQGISYREFDVIAESAHYAAVVMLVAVGLWAWRFPPARWPTLFGTLWFLILILPVSGITPIGIHVVADRYFYLPGVGLILILSFGLLELAHSGRLAKLAALSASVALTYYWFSQAGKQLYTWRDDIALCTATLRHDPQNVIALNNLAWAISQSAPDIVQAQRAIEAARTAARLTRYRDPNILGTLAASHAAAKDFKNAYIVGHQALLLAERLRMGTVLIQLASQRDAYDHRLQAVAQLGLGSDSEHDLP
jgi:hypothetical protein